MPSRIRVPLVLGARWRAVLLAAAALASASAPAGPLTDALQQARSFDPQYQAARAERDSNQNAAQSASSAYYPQFQATYARLETELADRQTYTLTQPLLSGDRYATLQEAEPREIWAQATFVQRDQELSQRLVKALSELLRNAENLRLNAAKREALTTQAQSAKKAYELGQGTLTDQRDAQVRLDQTRAEALTLAAQIESAKRQLSAITGQPAESLMLRVPQALPALPLKPAQDYLDASLRANPQLLLAQQNQRLAEVAVTRAQAAFLPNLSAVYTNTSVNNSHTSYTGLQLSMPLQAGSVYQMRGAQANASKLQEQTRDAQVRAQLEVQRLWSLVDASRSEIAIRLEAIRSAELSVEANQKSYLGGVRSLIDVLNSIQTRFQVQQEYVNATLTLADNYLNLLLQAATPVDEAIAQVQAILFPAK